MVLYNLFSAPYIISFVESDVGACGDSSPIAPIMTLLSQVRASAQSHAEDWRMQELVMQSSVIRAGLPGTGQL